ncbi:MAG TPA: RluA family pseudouridine synthase [Phycisphaerae bacterium]|jgi:RluA family pseudouridine synthase|nr:RluA family pseudouridine synthase [Phycisphaerae bacterium]
MKKSPPYQILLHDDHLIAVNKSARLAVLPGRGRTHSLMDLLTADPALKSVKPFLVHRIDADTTGIILLALTSDAQKHLAAQFRERTVTKEYLALVRGTPLHESGSVDLPIGSDPHNKNRMVIRGLEPKKARTKWVLAERFKGISLLKVFPITGRRHQIRVHLKAMGYPLAVDPYYGGDKLLLSEFKKKFKLGKFQEERPLMDRLTLHARALTFKHPADDREVVVEAPLPRDFEGALEALRKWAS